MPGTIPPECVDLLGRVERRLGEAAHGLVALAESDPGFLTAYADLADAVWAGTHIPLRDKHLICLAVNASVTHLHAPGVVHHLRQALAAGATEREIVDVLETISVLGVHTVTTGFPILVEEMAKRGQQWEGLPLSPEQDTARRAFIEARGSWNPRFEPVARLAPAYLANYAAFSGYTARRGVLDAKLREFIYIAIDSGVTHIFQPGLRAHVATALDLGATGEEIAEVLALVSLIGIEGCILGVTKLPSASAAMREGSA